MSEPTRESRHGRLELDDPESTEQLPPVESPESTGPSGKSDVQESPARAIRDPENWVRSADDARPAEWREPDTGTGFALGLGLVVLGFVAIGFAWSKVAALTNVAQQVPYMMSAGVSGLMLIIIGVVIVDVTVRRRDSHERRSQLSDVTYALADLRDRLEPEQEEDR